MSDDDWTESGWHPSHSLSDFTDSETTEIKAAHRTTPTHAVAGGGCATWAGYGRHPLRPSQKGER